MAKCSILLALLSLLVIPLLATPINRRVSTDVIKKLNREGPYVGLITVMSSEEDAFFDTGAFRPHPLLPSLVLLGRTFRVGKVHGKKVIYVRCGIGLVNAAAVTQQMLDMFDIAGIIHFGIAGNLNNSMSIGDVIIPKQVADTGIWDWVNPNGTIDSLYTEQINISNYNLPKGEGTNLLGRLAYRYEQLYSSSDKADTAQPLFWLEISKDWLNLAANMQELKLEQCVNSTLCLPQKPKLLIGLSGSTANTFLDNAAYREYLFQTFSVSSADMESSAVVMTSLSNGYPVIVIRGLSDLAGAQPGENQWALFGSLAASNAAKVVIQFIKTLPAKKHTGRSAIARFLDHGIV